VGDDPKWSETRAGVGTSIDSGHTQITPSPFDLDPSALQIGPGVRVGRYELIREIGRGGMGVVLLAERADGHFEQRVAIKLLAYPTTADAALPPGAPDLAHLEHAHIARLIDGGLSPAGFLLRMEYVEGLPIDDSPRAQARPRRACACSPRSAAPCGTRIKVWSCIAT
jgi:serine/threonine protein kinase